MRKGVKKAFTLAELIIVIAIVAILVTVAILGFSSYSKKSNLKKDETIISELNLRVSDYISDGKNKVWNVTDAYNVLIDEGIDLSNLTPATPNYHYGFDIIASEFVLLDANYNLVKDYNIPSLGMGTNKGHEEANIYAFVKSEEARTLCEAKGYSAYLQDGYVGHEITTSKGIDVGEVSGITELTYNNYDVSNAHSQYVIIYTNTGTTLNINGYYAIDEDSANEIGDEIHHFGNSGTQYITVALDSYHEHGAASFVYIYRGHYILEEGSIVGYINAVASKGTVNIDLKTNSIVGTITNSNKNNKVAIYNERGSIIVNLELDETGGELEVILKETPEYSNTVDKKISNSNSHSIHIEGVGEYGKNGEVCPSKCSIHDWLGYDGLNVRVCRRCAAFEYIYICLDENGNVIEETREVEYGEDKGQKGSSDKEASPDREIVDSKEDENHTHIYGQWYVVVEPTCISAGYNQRDCSVDGCEASEFEIVSALGHNYVDGKCSRCGKEKADGQVDPDDPDDPTDPTDPTHTHKYGDWVTMIEATCTSDGYQERHCSDSTCKGKEIRIIKALGHNYVKGVCSRCGKTQDVTDDDYYPFDDDNPEDPDDENHVHVYGKISVVKEATCINDGYGYRVCLSKKCNQTQLVVIQALGHEYDENGVCIRCNKKKSELEDSSHTHNYTNWTTLLEPSCTSDGYQEGYCSCGASKIEILSALGHNYNAYNVCTRCGHKKNISSDDDNPEDPDDEKHKHVYSDLVVVEQATCLNDGYGYRICTSTLCNQIKYEVISALGHSFVNGKCTRCGLLESEYDPSHIHTWGEWKIVQAATCSSDGYQERYCSICYARNIEIISALGHNYNENNVCTRCGHIKDANSDDEDDPFGPNNPKDPDDPNHRHVYGDLIVVSKATCISDGYGYRVCRSALCNQIKYEVISALGHNFINGTCTRCGTLESDYNNHSHSYGIWITKKEASCTSDGYQVRYCSCGAMEVKILEALGHEYDETKTCIRCGHKYDTTSEDGKTDPDYPFDDDNPEDPDDPNHSHVYGNLIVINAATCESMGLGYRVCLSTKCNQIKYEVISALGHSYNANNICIRCGKSKTEIESHTHNYGNWITKQEATCTTDGYKQRSCECGAIEIEIISALGHDYDDGICSRCGHKKSTSDYPFDDDNPEDPDDPNHTHVYGKLNVIEQATCVSDGYGYRVCLSTKCNQIKYEVINALGHNIVNGICTRCGKSEIVIDNHNHKYSDWEVMKEATCTSDGYKQRTCLDSSCGAREIEIINALGHKYNDSGICIRCGHKYDEDSEEYYPFDDDNPEDPDDPSHVHVYGDLVIVEDATCIKDGIGYRECLSNKCNQIKYEIISALGHSYDANNNCIRCGKSKTEIESHVHSYGDFEEVLKATCTSDGYMQRVCACGAREIKIINALGHNYVNGVCSRCGHKNGNSDYPFDDDNPEDPDDPKHTHIYGDLIIVEEPSCESQGLGYRVCLSNKCNQVKYEIISALGHNYVDGVCTRCKKTQSEIDAHVHEYGEWTIIQEASCITDGYKQRSCECGAKEFEIINALGHEYNNGICIRCGHKYDPTSEDDDFDPDYPFGDDNPEDPDDPKHVHVYGEWIIGKDASCIEDGYRYRVCKSNMCQYKQFEVLSAYGHNYINGVCSRCGDSKGDDHPTTHTHSYGNWEIVKNATCISEGLKKRTCGCGAIEYETIEKSAHSYVEDTSLYKEATCQVEGLRVSICSVCGAKKSEKILKKNHTYGSAITIVNATCESDGYAKYVCSVCGIEYQETTTKLGHLWVDTIIKNATCSETGLKSRKCSRCNAIEESVIIPAKGHNWVKQDGGTTSTCYSSGQVTYKCSVCSEIYVLDLPKTDHNYVTLTDSTLTYDATCSKNGQITYECSICKDRKVEIIKMIGHNYVTTSVTDATCEDDGEEIRVCTNCNDVKKFITKAFGHDYHLISSTKATCANPGKNVYKCDNCNATKEEEVSATNHNWSSWTDISSSTHQRSCQNEGCNAIETQSHSYTTTYKAFDYTDDNSQKVHVDSPLFYSISDAQHAQVCDTCGHINILYHRYDVNGVCMDCGFSKVVCKIGDKEYYSVQAAIADAKAGDTVVMVDNMYETGDFIITNANITLDLNGKTLTLGNGKEGEESNHIIIKKGAETFTINDSSGTGKITGSYYKQGTGDSTLSKLVYGAGGLIELGSEKESDCNVNLVINGGTIENTSTNYYGSTIYLAGNDCSVTVNGGTIVCNAQAKESEGSWLEQIVGQKINYYAGAIKSAITVDLPDIYYCEDNVITVNGGELICNAASDGRAVVAIYGNNADVFFNNGKVDAEVGFCGANIYINKDEKTDADIYIDATYAIMEPNQLLVFLGANYIHDVRGGTYTTNDVAKDLTSDYTLEQKGNTYVVRKITTCSDGTTNHDFSVVLDSKVESCYENGYTKYKCSKCSETYTSIISGGHIYVWDTSNNSYHSATCSRCNQLVYNQEKHVLSDDNICIICGKKLYCCEVTINNETTQYTTLEKAIEALNSASNDATLKLLDDINSSSTIELTNETTINGTRDIQYIIDLNGHTLTLADNCQIKVSYGWLLVSDSSENNSGLIQGNINGSLINITKGEAFNFVSGTIYNTNTSGYDIYQAENAVIFLAGGTLKGTYGIAPKTNEYFYFTYKDVYDCATIFEVDNILYSGYSYKNINGGIFKNNPSNYLASGYIAIKDSNYNNYYTIWKYENTTAATCTESSDKVYKADLKDSSGQYPYYREVISPALGHDFTTYINTNSSEGHQIKCSRCDVCKDYLEAHDCNNDDRTCKCGYYSPVASIGEDTYATLAKAFESANSASSNITIKLLQDVTNQTFLKIDKGDLANTLSITLDLNGKSITFASGENYLQLWHGTLFITDTFGGGSISSSYTYTVECTGSEFLTLNNGIIKNTSANGSALCQKNNATLNIYGGTLIATNAIYARESYALSIINFMNGVNPSTTSIQTTNFIKNASGTLIDTFGVDVEYGFLKYKAYKEDNVYNIYSFEVSNNPTCTVDGTGTYKKITNTSVKKEVSIPKLGHILGDVTKRSEDDANYTVSHVKYCTREGCSYLESINHTIDATTKTCVCGYFDAEATVNGVGYATLAEAINVANSSTEDIIIKIEKDISNLGTLTFDNGNTTTTDGNSHDLVTYLNLNGHTLTLNDGCYIKINQGWLAITDNNSGKGQLIGNNGSYLIEVTESEFFSLLGGTIWNQGSGTVVKQDTTHYVLEDDTYGTVYFFGGTVKGASAIESYYYESVLSHYDVDYSQFVHINNNCLTYFDVDAIFANNESYSIIGGGLYRSTYTTVSNYFSNSSYVAHIYSESNSIYSGKISVWTYATNTVGSCDVCYQDVYTSVKDSNFKDYVNHSHGTYNSSTHICSVCNTHKEHYTLTFNTDDANKGTVSQNSLVAHYGTSITKSSNKITVVNTNNVSKEIIATAKSGYTFDYWTNSDKNSVEGNYTFVAHFIKVHAINASVNDSDGGTISYSNSGIVVNNTEYNIESSSVAGSVIKIGSTGKITATAKEGYIFVNWTITGNTNNAITSDATFTANFVRAYTVNISCNSGGSIDTEQIINVPKGSIITINGSILTIKDVYYGNKVVNATKYEGYYFDSWSVSNNATITSNLNITATFGINKYQVTLNSNDKNMGTINPTLLKDVAYWTEIVPENNTLKINGEVVATASPTNSNMYYFDSWSISSSTTIKGALTITATFKYKLYDITFTNGSNGSYEITKNSSVSTVNGTTISVPYNSSVVTNGNVCTITETINGLNGTITIKAKPDETNGYELDKWTINSSPITKKSTISVSYKLKTFTVTVKVNDNQKSYGEVSNTSITDVPWGTTLTYDSDGKLKIGNSQKSKASVINSGDNAKTYKFSNFTSNDATNGFTIKQDGVVITANFEYIMYKVSTAINNNEGSSISGGSISDAVQVTYNSVATITGNTITIASKDGNKEITVTPLDSNGYELKNWSITNGAKITGNTTITANVGLKVFDVTVKVDDDHVKYGKVKFSNGSYTSSLTITNVKWGSVIQITSAANSSSKNYLVYDTQTVIASTRESTEIYSWKGYDCEDNSAISKVVENDKTTGFIIKGYATIIANFKYKTYTLSREIINLEDGTLENGGILSIQVNKTTNVTFSAEVSVSTNNKIIFKPIYGSTTRIITATPDEGYELKSWTITGLTSKSTITLLNGSTETCTITEKCKITANFGLKTYKLTIGKVYSGNTGFSDGKLFTDTLEYTLKHGTTVTTDSTNGTISFTAASGTSYTITASVDDANNSRFAGWDTETINGITKDIVIKGTFIQQFLVSVEYNSSVYTNYVDYDSTVNVNKNVVTLNNTSIKADITNYIFNGWTYGISSASLSSSLSADANTSFENVHEPLYLKADFYRNSIVHLDVNAGGSVTTKQLVFKQGTKISANVNVITGENSSASVTANPNDGYMFDYWSDKDGNKFTSTILGSDISLYANFIQKYTLTISANNGSIPSNQQTYYVAKGTTLTVYGDQLKATGTIINSSNERIDANNEVIVSASANSGKSIKEWTFGGTSLLTKTVESNLEIVASFAAAITLTIQKDNNNGSIDKTSVSVAENVSVIATSSSLTVLNETIVTSTPNSGLITQWKYYYTKWLGIKKGYESFTSKQFDEDSTIKAYFISGIKVNFNANNSNYGSISKNSDYVGSGDTITIGDFGELYVNGSDLLVIPEAKDNYTFNNWTNGSTAFASGSSVTSEITLTANFIPLYTISIVSEDTTYGTISIENGKNIVAEGSVITIDGSYIKNSSGENIATATSIGNNYKFDCWNDGTNNLTSGSIITINNNSVKLIAKFIVVRSIIIAVNNGDYGYVKNSSNTTVTAVDVQSGTVISNSTTSSITIGSETLEAVANTGYEFTGWSCTGWSSNLTSCTVPSSGEFTVIANFVMKKITINITINTNDNDGNKNGGTLSNNKFTNVPYYSAITINSNTITINGSSCTATINTGYMFDGWYNGNTKLTNGSNTSGLTSITAKFKQLFTVTVSVDKTGDDNFVGGYINSKSSVTFYDVPYGYKLVKVDDNNFYIWDDSDENTKQTITIAAANTKSRYKGLYDGDSAVTSDVVIQANKEFKAKFIQLLTVTFKAGSNCEYDDDSDSQKIENIEYGTQFTITKSSETDVGWNVARITYTKDNVSYEIKYRKWAHTWLKKYIYDNYKSSSGNANNKFTADNSTITINFKKD